MNNKIPLSIDPILVNLFLKNLNVDTTQAYKMHKQREIILVMGRTGMGKSIWTRSYMKEKRRVFAFDPLMEFSADYVHPEELIRMHDEGLLGEDERLQALRVGITDENAVDLLGSLAFLHGDCYLVLEEGGLLYGAGARAPTWMREAVFLGRHRNLSIVITAQRPTSIPVDLRSQASRVICFNQREQRDMQWLDEYYGVRSDEITGLEDLECLDSEKTGISRYKIKPENDDKMLAKSVE